MIAGAGTVGSPRRGGLYDRIGKRVLDVGVASIALVLLSPLLLLSAVIVLIGIGRPVLHADERAGRNGIPFVLRKFRTMTLARDATGALLPDERRLTAVGRFLRSTSLDELPELAHVVRGEMSLVGPRPLPVRYVARYTAEQARRLEVLPGVTGLAQTHGRNNLSWDEKFALDVAYVDGHGAMLDLKLLSLTLIVVLGRRGINEPNQATAGEFRGALR